MFVPHFSEYASRLSLAMATAAEMLFVVDARNFTDECDAALRGAVRARTKLVTFDSVGRPARVRALASTLAAVAAFRPETILVQEQIDSLTAWICRLAHRLAPIVLTIHDPLPHTGLDAAYARENARNRRDIRASASGFHVHGDFCREQLAAELRDARPMTTTAHGIILVPRAAQIRAPDPGRILMFGRMEAYKGLSVLLDAADLLSDRGRSFCLVIAGKGSEIIRLRARIAASHQIELIDAYLSPDEAITQFQRASFVTTPYVEATQSGVVAAAFANGRPVVATNSGGLPDAVHAGVNGLLVPPNDAIALADAIDAMLSDSALLASTTAGARSSAVSDFDWAPISAVLLEFMRSIRAGGNPERAAVAVRPPT
jgi:glycosyltransferase involved in cell wall biosynthesis